MTAKGTLLDFGEWQLVRRIKKIVDAAGNTPLVLDDAAPASLAGYAGLLFLTTDPCPLPSLVQRIGMGDYYHAGWLCVVRSLSDLAAAGSAPLGVTLAVEFPPSTAIRDFDAFFTGAAACARHHSTSILGGNIKETSRDPHAVSFALGATLTRASLTRGTARPGDRLILVDASDFGGFWAGVAAHLRRDHTTGLATPVLHSVQEMALMPKAKLREAMALLSHAPPGFVMDNSDGLLASAIEVAVTSHVDVLIDIAPDQFSEAVLSIASSCGGDPRVWALGWGGCQLLCVCSPAGAEAAEAALHAMGVSALRVGEVYHGDGRVRIRTRVGELPLRDAAVLRGEQFLSDSFWSTGIDSYIDMMLNKSLETLLSAK